MSPSSATILSGPTPNETGRVVFTVRSGGDEIELWDTPLGIDFPHSDDFELMNAAEAAVLEFWKEKPGGSKEAYREAARLRRAAGNPPLGGVTRSRAARVVGKPKREGEYVEFEAKVGAATFTVLIRDSGRIADGYLDAEGVTGEDRDAATTVVLDHVFANPDLAGELGLDLELLEELFR